MFTMKDGELTMVKMKILLVLLSGIPTWQRILSIYIILESSYVIFPSRMAVLLLQDCQVAISAQLVVSTCCILVAKGGSNVCHVWVWDPQILVSFQSYPIGFSNWRVCGNFTRVAFAGEKPAVQRPAASCCTQKLPCTS